MLEITTQIKEFGGARADRIPDAVLSSTQPLVMRGLAADWPIVTAAKKSAADAASYLQSFDSGKLLTAMAGAPEIDGRIFYNSDLTGFNFEHRRLPLAQILQTLIHCSAEEKPPTLYVGSSNVDHWLPGFRDDNDLALQDQDPVISLWISSRSRIAAH